MREFFDRLNLRIAEFMQDRYGMDTLNRVLLIVGLIFVVFGPILSPLDIVGWVLVVLAFIRALSKHVDRRENENEKFLKVTKAPVKGFKKTRNRVVNRKTTVYFKCDSCKQPLSVPKGKGKIRIICPKCGKEIFKNT